MDVRQLLGPRFEELAGAHAAGEIPLGESLLNRLAADALRQRPDAPVESADIRVTSGEMLVRVRLRKPRFVPPITVAVVVERQPEFPASPVLVLRWRLPGLGGLASFAGPLVAAFGSAPPGVRLDGDRVYVDLARLLEERGMREALDHVKALRVDPRPGVLAIQFDVRVS